MRRICRNRDWKYRLHTLWLVLGISLLCACASNQTGGGEADAPGAADQEDEAERGIQLPVADVVSVEVTGAPDAYQFSVGVASPDEGCDQYADWWEVLTQDGELIYRRILAHSHVSEQPFVRSGGPVAIGPDTVVLVRAHMHPGGYGGSVFKGSVHAGFEEVELSPGLAAGIEKEPPQPTGCAF